MYKVRFYLKDGCIVEYRCRDIKVAYGWMEHPDWSDWIYDVNEVGRIELLATVTGEIIKKVECA